MTQMTRNVFLALGAVLGIPVTFAIFVRASYWFAEGRSPLIDEAEWLWWGTLVLSIVVGASLIYGTSIQPRWFRAVTAFLYAGAMVVALLGVHFFVACASGDCL
jgi:hypothetical protein